MSGSTFSPDGQWMWTGTEWVPAPPTSSLSSNSMGDSPYTVLQTELQIAREYGENRLQEETLQEITSFTDWTNIFISSEYRKRVIWIRFLIIGAPFISFWINIALIIGSLAVGLVDDSDTGVDGWALFIMMFGIPLLTTIISWFAAFKRFKVLREFGKENGRKTYSIRIYGRKSWTKQLDPIITKFEHLVNWTHGKQDVETKRKLMGIEIELKRLLKVRGRAQVLTAVVAGVAVGAAAKGFSQATGRK
jgi:MFS family permease